MLLALTLYYMAVAGEMPWTKENWRGGVRPQQCQTAETMGMNAPELYLYMDVVKVVQEETCRLYVDQSDEPIFNTSLLGPMIIMWVLCGLALIKGVKSYQGWTAFLVPLSFIFLIILIVMYVGLNNSEGGQGLGFYIGG